MNYTNGLFDCQSPTSPFLGSLRVLHLFEDLRAALDLMDPEEKESLRSQVSETTAEGLMEWLQSRLVGFHQTVCCSKPVKSLFVFGTLLKYFG